jgi:hypothetical protein
VQPSLAEVDQEVMTSVATTPGRHRSPEPATERIATLAEADRPGRHADVEADSPIFDALRDELAAVDWFSLARTW